jgi:hypothetical protein
VPFRISFHNNLPSLNDLIIIVVVVVVDRSKEVGKRAKEKQKERGAKGIVAGELWIAQLAKKQPFST